MKKRGRKPTKHEPLFCAGCGAEEKPRARNGVVLPHSCGSNWHLDLIRPR